MLLLKREAKRHEARRFVESRRHMEVGAGSATSLIVKMGAAKQSAWKGRSVTPHYEGSTW